MAGSGCRSNPATTAPPTIFPDHDRDYYLERRYPRFGNLVPRDVASRNAKHMTDEGRGVGETGLSVYLDFRDAIGSRARYHRRQVRQPVRHVPAHRWRKSLRGARCAFILPFTTPWAGCGWTIT
jgi:succinate dehydrogenase/fumarate reductase flavoprotein subunit